MEQTIFYKRVSSWIRSYRNPEALDWLRRFVDNSNEPANIKEQLYREIDYKETRLRQQPGFVEIEGISYLADKEGKPIEYANRFGAVCKLAELALKGYDVYLCELPNKYRITLLEEHKLINPKTGTTT